MEEGSGGDVSWGYRPADGLSHGPYKDPDTDGGKEKVAGQASTGSRYLGRSQVTLEETKYNFHVRMKYISTYSLNNTLHLCREILQESVTRGWSSGAVARLLA